MLTLIWALYILNDFLSSLIFWASIRAEVERLEVSRANLLHKIKEEVYEVAVLPFFRIYTYMLNNCHVLYNKFCSFCTTGKSKCSSIWKSEETQEFFTCTTFNTWARCMCEGASSSLHKFIYSCYPFTIIRLFFSCSNGKYWVSIVKNILFM